MRRYSWDDFKEDASSSITDPISNGINNLTGTDMGGPLTQFGLMQQTGGANLIPEYFSGNHQLLNLNPSWNTDLNLIAGGADKLGISEAIDGLFDGDSNVPGLGGGGGSSYTPSENPFEAPEYSQLLEDGKMPSQYQVSAGAYPTSLQGFKDYATSDTASPWLQLTEQQIGDQGRAAGDLMSRQMQGQVAGARENLASKVGLKSGAAERLEAQGLREAMLGEQRLGQSVQDQLLDARQAEQTSKLGALGRLPGMEMAQSQLDMSAQQQNIANLMAERQSEYKAAQDMYNTQMQTWSALELAKATAAAGGGGGGGGGSSLLTDPSVWFPLQAMTSGSGVPQFNKYTR